MVCPHEIDRLEDGRVTYVSDFEDHLQVIAQWGGPLPTLGRLVSTLLSPRVLSKMLSQSTVGPEFDELLERFGELVGSLDSLKRGRLFEDLHGQTLGCYCAPRPCHGDVVAEWADRLTDSRETPHTSRLSIDVG